jgi:hypothetical protein
MKIPKLSDDQKNEAKFLAMKIRQLNQHIQKYRDHIRELCRIAGLENVWHDCESFEEEHETAKRAAEICGVTIEW